MKKDDGGPAFPRGGYFGTHSDGSAEYESSEEGMSLLDYLAGQALQGFIAGGGMGQLTDAAVHGGVGLSDDLAARAAASYSYRLGRAMLAERLKERPA